MKILFTSHAREQLAERRLSEEMIRDVISAPDRILERKDGTRTAEKLVRWEERKVLCRVIYRTERDETHYIITAYVTTKFEKYDVSP